MSFWFVTDEQYESVWTIPLTNQKHLIQLDGFLALAELCFSFLLHFSRVVLQNARPLWVSSVHLPQDFDELIQTGYVVNRVKHSKANKSLISNTCQSNAILFLIQATVEELSSHSITRQYEYMIVPQWLFKLSPDGVPCFTIWGAWDRDHLGFSCISKAKHPVPILCGYVAVDFDMLGGKHAR